MSRREGSRMAWMASAKRVGGGIAATLVAASLIAGANALLLKLMTDRKTPVTLRVAVDLAPDELLEFESLLRSIEPRLGNIRIEPVYLATDNQLVQAGLAARGAGAKDPKGEWDLLIFDNDTAGAMIDHEGQLLRDLGTGLEPDPRRADAPGGIGDLGEPARRLLEELNPAGRIHVVPFRLNAKIGFYNKGVFSASGPKPRVRSALASPPRSLGQLARASEALARRTPAEALERGAEGKGRLIIQGFPYRASAATMYEAIGGDDELLAKLHRVREASSLKRGRPGNPQPALDEADRRKLAPILEDLLVILCCVSDESPFVKFDTASDFLLNRKVDLLDNWSYCFHKIVEEPRRLRGDRAEVAPGTHPDIGVYEGWQERHVLGGDVLAIPSNAPNPEQARRLLKELLGPDVQNALANEYLRWIPARRDAIQALPEPLRGVVNHAVENAIIRPSGPGRGPESWKGKDSWEGTLNALMTGLTVYTKGLACEDSERIEKWYGGLDGPGKDRVDTLLKGLIRPDRRNALPAEAFQATRADGPLFDRREAPGREPGEAWRRIIRLRSLYLLDNPGELFRYQESVAPMAAGAQEQPDHHEAEAAPRNPGAK